MKNRCEKNTTNKLYKSGAPERLLAKSGPQRVPGRRPKIMKNEVLQRLASEGRSSIDFSTKTCVLQGCFSKSSVSFESVAKRNTKRLQTDPKIMPKMLHVGLLWLRSRTKR